LDNGIVYIAFGTYYVSMCYSSVVSLRNHSKLPVLIISNEDLHSKFQDISNIYFKKVIEIDDARLIKTNLLNYTLFNKTIFLDCDTLVFTDLSFLFNQLNFFDLLIKQRNSSYNKNSHKGQLLIEGNTKVKDLSHWNSGVFCFVKNKNTELFFSKWFDKFKDYSYSFDQPSLVYSVYNTDIKIASLEDKWNYQNALIIYNKNKDHIIHYSSSTNVLIRKYILKNCSLLEKKLIIKKFTENYKKRIYKIGKYRFIKYILKDYIQFIAYKIKCLNY
jgi:hypothetical protein